MIHLMSFLISFAFAGPDSFKMYENDKYIDVHVQTFDKMQITKDCFKGKTPKCDAFTVTKAKTSPRAPQSNSGGHPAVSYCHDKGGVARILKSTDNKEYDYCRFKDGSMIDAWHLYYHHFPNK